jgi:hypothetical protein
MGMSGLGPVMKVGERRQSSRIRQHPSADFALRHFPYSDSRFVNYGALRCCVVFALDMESPRRSHFLPTGKLKVRFNTRDLSTTLQQSPATWTGGVCLVLPPGLVNLAYVACCKRPSRAASMGEQHGISVLFDSLSEASRLKRIAILFLVLSQVDGTSGTLWPCRSQP